jgi:hypothetical protein
MDQTIKDRYSKLRGEPIPDYAEKIPEIALQTLLDYVEFGLDPGDFMEAFLSNDLFDALARADKEMLPAFKELFWFIHNRLPASCNGSREKVREWKRARREARWAVEEKLDGAPRKQADIVREQVRHQFAGIITPGQEAILGAAQVVRKTEK